MIVISGALVLVALVLLVIGIVGPELGFVYASIGVSLVSLAFLVVGILQRRGETLPGATPVAAAPTAQVEDPSEGLTAVLPSAPRQPAAEPPVADSVDEEPAAGGTVLVVAGRPRYHVDGCRYLSGKDAEAVDVRGAREEGFTPCGVCKPDDVLAGAAPVARETTPLALEEVEASSPTRVAKGAVTSRRRSATAPAPAARPARATRTAPPVVADVEPATVEPVDAPPAEAPAKPSRAARAAKAVPAVGAVAAVAAVTAAKAKPAAKPAAAPVGPAAKPAAAAAVEPAPAPAPAAAPARPAKAAAATASAGAAKRSSSVVVIPDRGRFHRSECRYVRDVEGAEVLTRAAAARQGYDACGVCKP